MGFGKAFGIGLVIFILLNFLFAIIGAAIGGNLNGFFSSITSSPMSIIYILFGAMLMVPFMAVTMAVVAPMMGDIGYILTSLSFFVIPLLTAIIAGRLGGSKGASFGSWFLICIISSVLLIVLTFMDPAMSSLISAASAMGGIGGVLAAFLTLMPIFAGIINGFFYGCFALLSTSSEYY